MLEVICHDCEMDVVEVEDGVAVLRVEDAHWIFTIPLTAPLVAGLIEKLSAILLAVAA